MNVYAFDVDDTLEISNGPVPLQSLMDLRIQGHIVGLCGNWGLVTSNIFGWQHLVSFVNCCPVMQIGGEIVGDKAWFLSHLKQYIRADDYVLVGNVFGRINSVGRRCGSYDSDAAAKAGWRFILEDDFAKGMR